MSKEKTEAFRIVERYAQKANKLNQVTTFLYDVECAKIFVAEMIDQYRVKSLQLARYEYKGGVKQFAKDKQAYWSNVLTELNCMK